MKKLIFIASALLFASLADAAVYKGQKIFVKKCVDCHTEGQSFVSSKSSYEWEDYMANKGEKLAEVHLDNEQAKSSWKYFESKKYKKKTKHLADFLYEFASDSGNVPACN